MGNTDGGNGGTDGGPAKSREPVRDEGRNAARASPVSHSVLVSDHFHGHGSGTKVRLTVPRFFIRA